MADGRGHRAAARGVERAGVPAGAGRQEGRRRARRHRARASSAQQEQAGHRAGQGRRGGGDHGRASPACRAPRARRWPSWSRTRARPSPRTRPSAPRSPTKIQGIFAATEADVKKILDGIDPKVEKEFERGRGGRAGGVRDATSSAKMSAYKKDRYGGWLGGLRWAKDKLLGMPDKVNEFYEAGRELYLKQMDGVISRVADIVGDDLTAAKKRIATGKSRDRRRTSRACPRTCRRSGSEASKEIGEQVRAAGERRQRQAGGRRRHPRHEVRRGPQGPRRADRGAAGREQGPGRQGDRRDQGRHQHDPRARGDADERALPGGRRGRRHHQGARSGSSAT